VESGGIRKGHTDKANILFWLVGYQVGKCAGLALYLIIMHFPLLYSIRYRKTDNYRKDRKETVAKE
jgi:ACR3 family arsenite efflux pump ArsB